MPPLKKRNLFIVIGEYWVERQAESRPQNPYRSSWLPTPGNILFTLLIAGLLIFTQRTWADPNNPDSINVPGPSATTINYQGSLAAPDGTPKNGTFGMSFAIYDAATGGNIIWGPENHSAIPVSDGLFNVGLGSQTSGGIPTTVWNGDRYLQISVGGEALTPRELIRSVPIAGMALTVPDGAIGASKIQNGVITQQHAPGLLASASGNNVKVYFGSSSVAPAGSQTLLSKTITISEPCPNLLKAYVQPNWNYHNDVIANVGTPWDGSKFTVFLSRTGGGAWTTGQEQSFDWLAICQ